MRSLIFLLLSLAFSLHAADVETRRFLWSQANTLAAEAQTPAEFRRAAGIYRELLADGVDNAPLWLNFGATLVMAGDAAPAIAAFKRAECLEGISADSAAGMKAAYARRPQGQAQVPPWQRTIFYPHFFFSCRARAQAAALAFGVALLFLLPPRLTARWRAFWLTCALLCGIFGLLCGLSSALSRFEGHHLPPLPTEAAHD